MSNFFIVVRNKFSMKMAHLSLVPDIMAKLR